MGKSRILCPIRILTDMEIKQSQFWGEKTTYVGDLNSNHVFTDCLYEKMGDRFRFLFNFLMILRHYAKYDVVITGHIKTAQLFALIRKILRIKKPRDIILGFMLDEKNNPLWKVKKVMQQYIFSNVDIIFVSSRREIETYSKRFRISTKQFRFLPFHTNVIEPKMVKGKGGIF